MTKPGYVVIGFEGARDDESPVNWGTAAIASEKWILNAATRHRTSRERLDDLAAEGHITRLPEIPLDERFTSKPLVVVELDRTDTTFPFLSADTGRIGGLATHRAGKKAYVYVFETPESFDMYAREVASKIARAVLYETALETAAQTRLVRAGLILAAQHPALNAIHVANTKGGRQQRAKTIALSTLESDSDRATFEDVLDALTDDTDDDYVIKYEDGIAEGGGLDVDKGVLILGSAKSAHVPLVRELLRKHPYLMEPPPPRFHHMAAASASLHFTANIEGRPLGERVARKLELRLLERSLRGELPEVAQADRAKVERAVQVLRRPDEQTTVSHVPMGGEVERLSGEVEQARGRRVRSEPFTVLGYQSGMIRLADEVEIVIFPRVGKHHRGRLLVSTRDDGDGEEPLGVLPLQQGRREILWQPMLVTFMRVVEPGGRERTFLRQVKMLEVGGRGRATALPSSVVDGALLYGFSFQVRRIGRDRLTFDLGAVKGLDDATLDGARDWMDSYGALCKTFELQPAGRTTFRYWRPARPPSPTALQRILAVLKKDGPALHQSELIALINERFGGPVRANNTRREVLENPTLLTFDPGRVIRLLPAGEEVAAAFERAGGEAKKKPKRTRP